MKIISDKAELVAQKYKQLSPMLNERVRRLWCAAEAQAIGRGGISLVCRATGVSRPTITNGLKELVQEKSLSPEHIRKKGGGRKRLSEKDIDLLKDLNDLIEPATRGDPENPLRWTSKSTIKLAEELNTRGHTVTQRTVYSLLKSQGYSLKASHKTKEGNAQHPDRDAQFNYISNKTKEFQKNNNPVLSVDTKKKENIGNYKNVGEEWTPKGERVEVNAHDFPDETLGKAAPYGIYDITTNKGWVNVGVSHDTAEFAVNSIRTWWEKMGKESYKDSTHIMITADCGGSNGNRVRLWKVELQKLADELGKSITVCHFPPGTSKWNKIEHRMFSYISKNWRGQSLISVQAIVELIGHTTTKTGLKILTNIDKNEYITGRKISKEELSLVNIERAAFQPLWNYTIRPRSPA